MDGTVHLDPKTRSERNQGMRTLSFTSGGSSRRVISEVQRSISNSKDAHGNQCIIQNYFGTILFWTTMSDIYQNPENTRVTMSVFKTLDIAQFAAQFRVSSVPGSDTTWHYVGSLHFLVGRVAPTGQEMPRCDEFTVQKSDVEALVVITTLKPHTEFGPVLAARIVIWDGIHGTDVMVPSVVNKDKHAWITICRGNVQFARPKVTLDKPNDVAILSVVPYGKHRMQPQENLNRPGISKVKCGKNLSHIQRETSKKTRLRCFQRQRNF